MMYLLDIKEEQRGENRHFHNRSLPFQPKSLVSIMMMTDFIPEQMGSIVDQYQKLLAF